MKTSPYVFSIAIAFSPFAWAGSLTGFSSPKVSSSQGFYAGASVGSTLGDLNDACDAFDTNCNNWKVYGGYRFNANSGIEGGYYSMLGVSKEGTDLTVTGIGIVNTLNMPVGKTGAEVFGKAGILYGTTEWTTNVYSGNSFTQSVSSMDFLVGVGASYKFSKNWGARGEFEHIQESDASASLLSGGVTFSTF